MILLFFCVFFLMIRRPPKSTRTDTLFPYTTLFRSATEEFFARIGFNAEDGAKIEELRAAFSVPAERFEMNWAIHDGGHRMKVLLMVSNYGHCLNNLLYRWRIGALPIEIVGVVSNHMTYQKLVVNPDIPFHHISVTKDNKPETEAHLLKLVEDSGSELIVLASYMHVLSDSFCSLLRDRKSTRLNSS